VADRLVVSATRVDTEEKLTFTVDAKAPGISYLSDWDNSGQRLTASGGVLFEDVTVDAADVLRVQSDTSIRLSLAALGFQLTLAQVYVGIAEGALAHAADCTRTQARPWFLSDVDKAVQDPYIDSLTAQRPTRSPAGRTTRREACVPGLEQRQCEHAREPRVDRGKPDVGRGTPGGAAGQG
jgi:alkylation response protein AidB-like acyl-CoA dehydrogenase